MSQPRDDATERDHTSEHTTEHAISNDGVISNDDVAHVANLARIELAAHESERLTDQLRDIVSYVDSIRSAAGTTTAPMSHPTPMTNVLRADEVRVSLTPEAALAMAPASEQQRFSVPRILEED